MRRAKDKVRSIFLCMICAGILLTHGFAGAADYPSKPVRIIVPFVPGGGVDYAARFVAQKLTEVTGQNAIVDNRAGAGGNIANEIVAKSAPDGYTLLVTHNAMAINPALFKQLPYDAVRDFSQVALVGTTTNTLIVNPKVPARNVKELIALFKSKPGEFNYASSGIGGTAHLGMEYFMMVTGTKVLHVPYKGGAPMLTETVGGQVQVAVASLGSAMPFINAKRLVALATTGAKRSAFLPEIPTLQEAGVPGSEFDIWYGAHAPSKTPREIIGRLNAMIAKALTDPAAKQYLAAGGIEAAGRVSPEEFTRFVRAEIEKMRKVVTASGAQQE